MSHLHIPDGILPFYLPVLGFVITGLIIAVALYRLRNRDVNKLVPRLGIVSAFILVVMSVPLGFIPYHLNLTVLAGIILGPGLGFISIFLVNLLLGFIGHGGITMVGLNSLAVGSEAFLGYYLFRLLYRRMKVSTAAALTTILTLAVSSMIMISVVAVSQVDPAVFMDRHTTEVHKEEGRAADDHKNEAPADETTVDETTKLSVPRFAAMTLPVTVPGAMLESLAVFGIVRFLWRVRPDILGLETEEITANKRRKEAEPPQDDSGENGV